MGHATRLPWERERTVAAPQPLAEPNEKHTRALISLRPASRAPSLPPLTTHAQTNQPTPVFGSGSTFGAGTGFAGFTGVSSSSAAPAAEAGGEEGEVEYIPTDLSECSAPLPEYLRDSLTFERSQMPAFLQKLLSGLANEKSADP